MSRAASSALTVGPLGSCMSWSLLRSGLRERRQMVNGGRRPSPQCGRAPLCCRGLLRALLRSHPGARRRLGELERRPRLETLVGALQVLLEGLAVLDAIER